MSTAYESVVSTTRLKGVSFRLHPYADLDDQPIQQAERNAAAEQQLAGSMHSTEQSGGHNQRNEYSSAIPNGRDVATTVVTWWRRMRAALLSSVPRYTHRNI